MKLGIPLLVVAALAAFAWVGTAYLHWYALFGIVILSESLAVRIAYVACMAAYECNDAQSLRERCSSPFLSIDML